MTIVTSNLPVLIRFRRGASGDGIMNDTPLTIVSPNLVELILQDSTQFEKKCAGVSVANRRTLGGFIQLWDAVRGNSPWKQRRVVESLALLDPSLGEPDEILADPMGFLQEELTSRAEKAAAPVLWQTRRGEWRAGLFCRHGMLDALNVLMLMYIGSSGKTSATSECVMCGASFPRQRSDRRKTCSDRCRKAAWRKSTRSR